MAEYEFKRGDRVVFVKDDEYGGVEMPKGTLATYDEDDPAEGAPWVKLDRVRAWRDSIAPAEDHGTGDGSASDICAEPGCNCDLERRFPAPLDPSKVKPGDTVTLTLEGAEVTDTVAAWERNPASGHYRAYLAHDPDPLDAKPFRLVGNAAYTLTDHQPAPEPEPEWEPGRFVSVRVNGRELPGERYQGFVTHHGTVMIANEDGSPESINLAHLRDVRPLAVIDPADVDLVALTKIGDEAYLTDQSEFRHDGIQAAILAALAHLGIEVPR